MFSEDFFIEGSNYFPEVNFNAEAGTLNISGDFEHQFVLEFFEPILDWLHDYLADGSRQLDVNFRLSDTPESDYLHEIIKKLKSHPSYQKNHLKINFVDE